LPLPSLLVLVLASAAGAPQGAQVTMGNLDVETYRYALSTERRTIMEANINLDLARRPQFFALYDVYDKEREPIDKERFSLLQRYASVQTGSSEPQAIALIRAVSALQIKEIQLRSRYADRINKEKDLGGLVAARFYQVDDIITTAIRLNTLQGVPLTGVAKTPR
jgi:hypothetical protein